MSDRVEVENDLSPLVPEGKEKEPALVLDISTSMDWEVAEGSSVSRKEAVMEALGGLIELLEADDSQAEEEAAAGEDAGGVMTVVFGSQSAVVGDLSSANWQQKLGRIRWGGGTHITPAWRLVVSNYLDEFGKRPVEERPALLVMVITDGEADDVDEFDAEMAKLHGPVYVCMAVVGYGEGHDKAIASYQSVAEKRPENFRLISLMGMSPQKMTEALHSLMG